MSPADDSPPGTPVPRGSKMMAPQESPIPGDFRSCGSPVVVPQQPAESRPASDVAARGDGQVQRWRGSARRPEPDGRVGALPVVVFDEGGREVVQMTRPQGDEPVQALVLERLDEALGEGVHVGRCVGQPHGPGSGLSVITSKAASGYHFKCRHGFGWMVSVLVTPDHDSVLLACATG